MSLALLFACLFILPAGTLASRTTAEEAQDMPWNKKRVVGALLGVVPMGDTVAGFPMPGVGSKPSHRMAAARGDSYDQVQTLLANVFSGRGPVDQASCGKLMDSLRRNTKVGDAFVQRLQELLSSPDLESPRFLRLEKDVIWQGGEQLDVIEDPFGVTIFRYPHVDHRTSEWVSRMQQHLEKVRMSKVESGLFLPYFAQSHSLEDFAMDTEGDMFFMLELSYGTVREVMQAHNLGYNDRVELFRQTFRVVQRLNEVGIPHRSDITPDTVIVRGGFTGTLEGKVVLSSDLIQIDSTTSAKGMWNADVQQLGTLLGFLMSGEFDVDMQSNIDVLRAFGKAMESGAFAGERNAAEEFAALVGRMEADMTQSDLVNLKLQYLFLSQETEMWQQARRGGSWVQRDAGIPHREWRLG